MAQILKLNCILTNNEEQAKMRRAHKIQFSAFESVVSTVLQSALCIAETSLELVSRTTSHTSRQASKRTEKEREGCRQKDGLNHLDEVIF